MGVKDVFSLVLNTNKEILVDARCHLLIKLNLEFHLEFDIPNSLVDDLAINGCTLRKSAIRKNNKLFSTSLLP